MDNFVVGQVICTGTGQPIASCTVFFSYYADDAATNPIATGTLQTDANGNFSTIAGGNQSGGDNSGCPHAPTVAPLTTIQSALAQ